MKKIKLNFNRTLTIQKIKNSLGISEVIKIVFNLFVNMTSIPKLIFC